LILECGDSLARERKCGFDVCVRYAIDFVFGDLQEQLPEGGSWEKEPNADVGVRPAYTHRAESSLDFFIVVVGYWERRCLG